MKPRFLFDDNGHVIRTTHSHADWWWGATAALCMVALYALAGAFEASDAASAAAAREALAQAHSRAFEAGRAAGREHAAQLVAAAYEQGRRDACGGRN